jgi:RNA polymerase sigma factor (sigma-70 family)
LADRLEQLLLARGDEPEPEFRQGILAAIASLRAYAISLTRSPDRADDLVQETVLRAWAKRGMFTPGTNLTAWLFTILRNTFYSEYRRRAHEVEDANGTYAARLTSLPGQPGRLDLQDLWSALDCIPMNQREALILVAAEGMSYEDAAAICGCAVGTIKSRVSRARGRLVQLLGHEEGDLASDSMVLSALDAGK